MRNLSMVICLCLFFQSCASMLSGTEERINVRSEVKGTKFYLNNTEYLGTDSISVKVSKKDLKYTSIYAKKAGCSDQIVMIPTKFDATSLFNLLLGYVGVVTFLGVDWGITGAVHEAERRNYLVDLKC